ncbi:hypothetical protein Sme01_57770 [Sphaerisporangium melleum]|uniref:Heparin-binding hemagglutinin n=1 Tax=Sphaerisporangium melleum TaxID=321316 RepID=A0A917VM35_9ACTN|nr:hypothetical protein [Sphaerisporangium melleum]GGK94980.1 hypothetical protein GCM10007964_41650 [Sphaerisporangium melleum]GII73301.1 hypothetical protein Sme01_57770 [Sphaerisporangium melleum]
MPINDEVKKIAESKPFYAVAGAGDFAVEKLRELPEQFQRLQTRRAEVGAVARELPDMARKYAANVQVKAEAVAKDLPGKAKEYADTISARAAGLYDEFASRGRKVVSRVTGETALELEEVSAAAEPAIAARPAARKNSRATGTRTTKA